MPTDQKLDEQAEARIREACVNLRGGSDSDRSGDEWHNPEPYDFDAPNATCLCRDLRAAILADREAREKPSPLVQLPTRDMLKAAEMLHADALAESLRAARSYYVYDHRLVGTEHLNAEVRAWDRLLAAHDALRGSK